MGQQLELQVAADRILLGESLRSIASEVRGDMLDEMGMDPEECPPEMFRKETLRYINELCRHLGERHPGDGRAAVALRAWVSDVEEYDAFDALLSNFKFDQRSSVLRRGMVLFPSALTSHWIEGAGS